MVPGKITKMIFNDKVILDVLNPAIDVEGNIDRFYNF